MKHNHTLSIPPIGACVLALLLAAVPTSAIDTDGITEFRSIDGSGNNVSDPTLGQARTPLARKLAPAYGDGTDLPRGVPLEDEGDGDIEIDEQTLPSARSISNAVHDQGANSFLSERGLNQLFFQFGQFLSHDTALSEPDSSIATGGNTGLSGNESFNIEVPAADPDFNFPEIPLTRSISVAAATSPTGIREQINKISAFLDGSGIYGSDQVRADALRSFVGGKLLSQSGPDGDLLPFNTFGLENANPLGLPDTQLFAAGDVRANEQVGLIAFHTLFLREHNRLCDEIAAQDFPAANLADPVIDEEIYQRARAVVAALLQKIAYHEWLPLLIGHGTLEDYSAYDPSVDPRISNEFSSAAFRLGHTMLPSAYTPTGADGTTSTLALQNAFFNPPYITANGIANLIRGQAGNLQEELDRFVVDDVRNFLFGPGFGGLDLASLNIQRGRDHGIPSYNAVRSAYGLTPAASFLEITGGDPDAAVALASVYASVDAVDLWTGGLCEFKLPGSNLGETFSTVFVDQFRRLRDGDRFYFENTVIYPQSFIDYIFSTTLTDILRRNTTIEYDELNGYVFHPEGFQPNQPDLRIGTERNEYLHQGDDIYSLYGEGQRIRIRRGYRGSALAWHSLENDGINVDHYLLGISGIDYRKFRFKAFDYDYAGRTNVTASLRNYSYYQELSPREIRTLQSRVKVKRGYRYGKNRGYFFLTAESEKDSYAQDVTRKDFIFR